MQSFRTSKSNHKLPEKMMKTVVDNDGYHIVMKDREVPPTGGKLEEAAQPIIRVPVVAHPVVVDGVGGRVVVVNGVHRLADQIQRQGVCIVQHQDTGELFAVLNFSDGSIRRWA